MPHPSRAGVRFENPTPALEEMTLSVIWGTLP